MSTFMIELLPVLQIANLAIQTARNQIPTLQEHRERCNLLVNRCERLLDEVSAQYAVNQTALVQKKVVLLESYVLILLRRANASLYFSLGHVFPFEIQSQNLLKRDLPGALFIRSEWRRLLLRQREN